MSAGCLGADELDAWIGGSVDDATRARAVEHVADCASCRGAASALARVRGGDPAGPPAPVEPAPPRASIAVAPIPDYGIGAAINDRLRRAAA